VNFISAGLGRLQSGVSRSAANMARGGHVFSS